METRATTGDAMDEDAGCREGCSSKMGGEGEGERGKERQLGRVSQAQNQFDINLGSAAVRLDLDPRRLAVGGSRSYFGVFSGFSQGSLSPVASPQQDVASGS